MAQYYTVQSGDWLSRIASRFGVSTNKLYEMNRAVIGPDMNRIFPGQRLVIPGSGSTGGGGTGGWSPAPAVRPAAQSIMSQKWFWPAVIIGGGLLFLKKIK